MKTNLAPKVVVLVLLAVIIIIGAIYMTKASPYAKQKEYDDAINNTVSRGGPPVKKPVPAVKTETPKSK